VSKTGRGGGHAATASLEPRVEVQGRLATLLIDRSILVDCLRSAPIAQSDRASDFGSEGWGFESLWAHLPARGMSQREVESEPREPMSVARSFSSPRGSGMYPPRSETTPPTPQRAGYESFETCANALETMATVASIESVATLAIVWAPASVMRVLRFGDSASCRAGAARESVRCGGWFRGRVAMIWWCCCGAAAIYLRNGHYIGRPGGRPSPATRARDCARARSKVATSPRAAVRDSSTANVRAESRPGRPLQRGVADPAHSSSWRVGERDGGTRRRSAGMDGTAVCGTSQAPAGSVAARRGRRRQNRALALWE
jgi:hypothetical protein